MRGADAMQENLFTVAKLEDFVPSDHPLRAIRVLVNDALAAMNARFNEIYAESGRDSIAPQKLIRALLLQVGRRHADSGRGRARRAFGPRMAAMISARVAVDATRRPIGKASRAATTPMPAPPTPDARLYRKSHNTASILCYQGHALMENRNGLVVSAVVTTPTVWASGARRWPCSMSSPASAIAAASVPTKPMTPAISSPLAASAMSPRTWRATSPVAVAVRLMRAPRAMRATG